MVFDMILRNRRIKYIALNLLLTTVLFAGGCSYSGKLKNSPEIESFTALSKTEPDGNLLKGDPEESDKDSSEELPEGFADILSEREILIDYVTEDSTIYALINSEGSSEEYGDYFVIYTKDTEGVWSRAYDNNFEELKPWKLETADIDGDSVREILIAVIKTTAFDPVEKNRMFIFNMTDGVLVKKWTGSQIAGTWRNFYTGNLIGDIPGEELIFIEQLQDGQERISVYSWFDFGFFLLADSDEISSVKELTVSGNNSIQITLGDGRTRKLDIKDGKLVTTEE
jgi:hypothetical protein